MIIFLCKQKNCLCESTSFLISPLLRPSLAILVSILISCQEDILCNIAIYCYLSISFVFKGQNIKVICPLYQSIFQGFCIRIRFFFREIVSGIVKGKTEDCEFTCVILSISVPSFLDHVYSKLPFQLFLSLISFIKFCRIF